MALAEGLPWHHRSGRSTSPLVSAQNSGFRFDEQNRHYTYDWRTDRHWADTCRQLVIRLTDGIERVLYFRFTR